MVKLLLLAGILSFLGYSCFRTVPSEKVQEATLAPADTVAIAAIDFDTDIKTILKGRCMPCHFPGGSMYARLPFDNPQTIRDHPEGIFKRIKDPEDVKKIRLFLDQKQEQH